jgi:chromosome partitioning protein
MKRDNIPPLRELITIDALGSLADRAGDTMSKLRDLMLLPDAAKNAPMVSAAKVCQLCDLTKAQLSYRIKNGAPGGVVTSAGGRREFTIEETRVWTRAERKDKMRPDSAKAAVIAVAFFKGGVTKTTTAMTLAQGLSLLGHRVLNIDLDPQGSLSTLHGLLPDSEIVDDDTLLDLFRGSQTDVRYAIKKTYWPGIDLVPAASGLFGAEFFLPSRQATDRNFKFWNVLNNALDPVREDYDVIILDTSPSLGYLTINALFAANGVLVPMTASMLDLASSSQFWALFHQLSSSIIKGGGQFPGYDFVNVLLSKINNNDATTRVVREWIQTVFGGKVLQTEIPLTTVTSSKAAEFATAYDIEKYEGDSRTYRRARDSYEALALSIEEALADVWQRQLLA